MVYTVYCRFLDIDPDTDYIPNAYQTEPNKLVPSTSVERYVTQIKTGYIFVPQ